jgi:hypothetical protein
MRSTWSVPATRLFAAALKRGSTVPYIVRRTTPLRDSQQKPITEDAYKFNPVTQMRIAIPLPADRAVVDVVRKVVEFYGERSSTELVKLTHAQDGPWDHVVTDAANKANIGLKISNEIIVQRFKYLWFGRQPKMDIEPNEDTPLVA